jgi:hypothetical protein
MVIPLSTSKGQEGLSWLYDHWLGLVNASILMAIFQSVWVYMWSFQSGELLAKGGNSGVFIYDVGGGSAVLEESYLRTNIARPRPVLHGPTTQPHASWVSRI